MRSDADATVAGWIPEGNLRPFLETIAGFIGYTLDEDDWTAIRYGVRETFAERGLWYEYSFRGDHAAGISVAYDDPGGSVSMFRVIVPTALEAKVEVAHEIMQRFELS